MRRNFADLEAGPFDLLVVGGGIYGAWAAYDGALRGLRVALVEKDDWSAATSSASSKLIHGGLRYLEYLRFGLVRKSLDERRRLARLAPHRVRPLPFLLPIYRGDRVGRLRMGLGLRLYDRLAGRGQPVAPHAYVDRDALLDRVGLEPEGLRGGFRFGDCQTDDARFTLEIVDGASTAGAVAVNRAEVVRLVESDGRVLGAVVEDRESGRSVELRATVTVGCAGAWIDRLTGATTPTIRRSKGVHLLLPGLPVEEALLLVSNEDDRVIFVMPWYGRTLLGTTDTDFDGDPDTVGVDEADVDYLLTRANRALPDVGWGPDDVIAGFAGLRTLPRTGDRSPSAVTREWQLDRPRDGLLVSVGGKYTSARVEAATLVDEALSACGRAASPCLTDERPFPWAPIEPLAAWMEATTARLQAAGLDGETARHCALRHGTRAGAILERIEEHPDLARRVAAEVPFCRAEIVHAVEAEMARDLEDVLRRRVPLLLLQRPSEPELEDAAALVGAALGWSAGRRQAEVRRLLARFPQPVAGHAPV